MSKKFQNSRLACLAITVLALQATQGDCRYSFYDGYTSSFTSYTSTDIFPIESGSFNQSKGFTIAGIARLSNVNMTTDECIQLYTMKNEDNQTIAYSCLSSDSANPIVFRDLNGQFHNFQFNSTYLTNENEYFHFYHSVNTMAQGQVSEEFIITYFDSQYQKNIVSVQVDTATTINISSKIEFDTNCMGINTSDLTKIDDRQCYFYHLTVYPYIPSHEQTLSVLSQQTNYQRQLFRIDTLPNQMELKGNFYADYNYTTEVPLSNYANDFATVGQGNYYRIDSSNDEIEIDMLFSAVIQLPSQSSGTIFAQSGTSSQSSSSLIPMLKLDFATDSTSVEEFTLTIKLLQSTETVTLSISDMGHPVENIAVFAYKNLVGQSVGISVARGNLTYRTDALFNAGRANYLYYSYMIGGYLDTTGLVHSTQFNISHINLFADAIIFPEPFGESAIEGCLQTIYLNETAFCLYCETGYLQYGYECIPDSACSSTTANGICPACTDVPNSMMFPGLSPDCVVCGDGVLKGFETCEDGNRNNFDGCNSGCRVEDKSSCDTSVDPNVCTCAPSMASVFGNSYNNFTELKFSVGSTIFSADPNKPTENLTCADIFEEYSSLGSNSSCEIAFSTLEITISEDNTIDWESTLTLNPGFLAREGCDLTTDILEFRQINLSYSLRSDTPAASFNYSQYYYNIEVCQDFTVDVNISRTQERPITILYEYYALDDVETTPEYEDYLALLNEKYSTGTQLAFNIEDLKPSMEGFVQKSIIKNYMGAFTPKYQRFKFKMPSVSVQANPPTQPVEENEEFAISFYGYTSSSCFEQWFVVEYKFYRDSSFLDEEVIDEDKVTGNFTYGQTSQFIFAPYTFTPGIKYVMFTLTYPFDSNSVFSANNSFEVLPGPPTVVVQNFSVPFDVRNPLTLDASQSYNPGSPVNQQQEGLEYLWSCTQFCDLKNGSAFNSVAQSVLEFEPLMLFEDETYSFNITVTYLGKPSSELVEFQTVRRYDPVILGINSWKEDASEGQAVNFFEDFQIEANVTAEQVGALSYSWIISPQIDEDYLEGYFTSDLKILAGGLLEDEDYVVQLEVSDSHGSDNQTFSFSTNSKPHSGSLSVSPSAGQGVRTKFSITSTGWIDDSSELYYQFGYYKTSADMESGTNFVVLQDFQLSIKETIQSLPNPSDDDADSQKYYLVVKVKDDSGLENVAHADLTISRYIPADETELENMANDVIKPTYSDTKSAILDAEKTASLIRDEDGVESTTVQKNIKNKLVEMIATTQKEKNEELDKDTFFQATKILNKVSQRPGDLKKNKASDLLKFVHSNLESEDILSGINSPESAKSMIEILANGLDSFQNYENADEEDNSEEDDELNTIQRSIQNLDKVSMQFIKSRSEPSETLQEFSTPTVTIKAGAISKENGLSITASSTDSASTSITLPQLTSLPTGSGSLGAIHKDWKANPFKKFSKNTNIVSNVQSLTFTEDGDELSVENLDEGQGIVFEYLIKRNADTEKESNPKCVSFDHESRKWLEDGINIEAITIIGENKDTLRVVCESSHLSDFSLGDEIVATFENSAIDKLDDYSALKDFNISEVKITYVLIFMFITLIILLCWGYQKDKNSSVLEKTLQKHDRILNIGMRDKIKDQNRKSSRSSRHRDSNEAEVESGAQSRNKKRRSEKNETVVNMDDVSSDTGSHKISDKTAGTKKRDVTADYRHKLENKQKIGNKKQTRTGMISFDQSIQKARRSFTTKFLHAIKMSHNLFSIFLRDDSEFPRSRRFVIYFLRWFGIIFVTSVFFQGLNSKSYSFVQIIVVSLCSFIVTGICQAVMTCLFKIKPANKRSKSQNEEIIAKNKLKYCIGILLALVYGIGTILGTILVGASASPEMNDALLIAFFIQVAQDIFINQMAKVMLNYFLLILLTKQSMKPLHGCIKAVLDNNLFIAFR